MGHMYIKQSFPDIDFSVLESEYVNNPEIFNTVETVVAKAFGSGYFITSNDEEAKRIIEDFCEKTNLEEKLIVIGRFLLVYGNCFIEKIFDRDNIIVDIRVWSPYNWRIIRDKHGEIKEYVQQSGLKQINFKPEEIIFMRWVRIGEKAFGLSPIQSLQDLHRVERWLLTNMPKIFKRYYSPTLIWYLPPEIIDEFIEKLKHIGPDEDIFVPGKPEDIKVQQLETRPAQWKEFFSFLERMKTEGLPSAPMSKRYSSTNASAKVIDEVDNERAGLLQRYVKRKLEGELFKPIIESYGLDEVPRLEYNVKRSVLDDVTLDEIVRLMEYDYNYARKLLALKGFPD